MNNKDKYMAKIRSQVNGEFYRVIGIYSSYEQALRACGKHAETNKVVGAVYDVEVVQVVECAEEDPCGECNECSTFCDVCGSWFWKDEPCELH